MLPVPAKAILRWARRVLVAADQLLNALLGGAPDETVSYRAAVAHAKGRAWACVLCRLLDLAQARHCERVRAARDAAATPLVGAP